MDSGLPLHLDVVAIEKGASGLPSTKVANFTYDPYFLSVLRKTKIKKKRNVFR